jgi:hypothetical protein
MEMSKPFVSESKLDRGISTYPTSLLYFRVLKSIEPSESEASRMDLLSVSATVFSWSNLKLAPRCPVKFTFCAWAIAI